MTGQQAVKLIDRLLDRSQAQRLNDLQSTIVLATWEGSTYRSIADRLSYDLDYIKQIAARLWKSLSGLLDETICKSNIRSVLERCQESIPIADWREPPLGKGDCITALADCDGSEIELPTAETWMISDRMTTIAFLCSSEINTMPQSLKLDRQVQHQIESLIYQNSYKPFTPNILMNKILSVLAVRKTGKNAVNCLIVNCYFDRSIIDN
ncbi:hypothetical protein [Chamaesiphon sp. VAR_48_metabat_135_sub]|uniref:hypothetical protein n=1 Tax=Chamaesiphon sp. VAR_48_metabat_135_sub TaxID=2964699 RepID=UPI00286D1176|nr:hypothetical protein [Chamaesiphon sp. VAR_48_metabat_135_sub]